MRKAVEPRGCARRFRRACDRDGDGRIGKREWKACLLFDINSNFPNYPYSNFGEADFNEGPPALGMD